MLNIKNVVARELQEALQVYALSLSIRLDERNLFEERFAFLNRVSVNYKCILMVDLLFLLFESRCSDKSTLRLIPTFHS